MVRAIKILILCLLTVSGFAQVVQERNARGADRIIIPKDGFRVPIRDTATSPALLNYSGDSSRGGVVYDSTLQKLCFWTGVRWVCLDDSATGGGGEVNTASNLAGAGVGIFKDKSGVDLRFKRLKAGNNITINDNTDSVTIAASSIGGTLNNARLVFSDNGNVKDTSMLVYDRENQRVGLGTATPTRPLDINYNNNTNLDGFNIKNTNTGIASQSTVKFENATGAFGAFGVFSATHGVPNLRNNISLSASNSIIFMTQGDLPSGGTGRINFSPGGFNAIKTWTNKDTFQFENIAVVNRFFSNTGSSALTVAGPDGKTSLAHWGSSHGLSNLRNTGGVANAQSQVHFANGNFASGGTTHISIQPGGFGIGGHIARFEQNGLHLQTGTSVSNNVSSLLEITSTTRGFLPPRMTTTQRNAISSPANGLQLYNTTTSQPNYRDATTWQAQVGMTFGTAAPTTTPTAVGNFFWDTNNEKLYIAKGTSSSADWVILN